ncbi:MAG: hypothetical protein GX444_12755 [Myxococcales bacterium]|nr:hypothetical protein [Myxococcales bacterium]
MTRKILLSVCFLFVFSFWLGCSDDDDDSSADDSGDDAADDDSVQPDDDNDSGDDDNDGADDDDDTTPDGPPADPLLPGPDSYGEAALTFFDPSSNQDQPLHVFYPTADDGATIDAGDGPRPVIVFGPGFSAPMTPYFTYGSHLATYGYVVVFRNNYVVSHVDLAATTSAIIDWLEDQEALPNSLFHGKIDLEKIGTTGHSMGGKISLLTAYNDDRVKASATIDPVDMSPLPTPAYPSVTPELMPDIHIPTLFVGGSNGGLCAPVAENYHQYFLYANPPSIEIMINHSGHVTFLDLPDAVISGAALICPTGDGDYEQIRALTKRYVTAFYQIVFAGEEGYRYYLTGDGIAQDVADGLVVTDSKP